MLKGQTQKKTRTLLSPETCRKLRAKFAQKISGVSFSASEEGCAKLSQICRESESQFRTILCKYPFSNAPFSKFLKNMLVFFGGFPCVKKGHGFLLP